MKATVASFCPSMSAQCTSGGKCVSLLVLFTLLVHPLSYFLRLDTTLSVYLTFGCYLVLLGYAIVNRTWFMGRLELSLFCIASIGCIFGAVLGRYVFGSAGFGSAIGFLLGMLAILSFSARLNRADVLLLLRVVAVFGVVAALYAFIFQSERWISILSGGDVGYHSWRYVSFFGQRNRFAACMYFAIVCSGALYWLTGLKRYGVAVAFLLLQVVCTNSRTALVASAVAVLLLIYFSCNNRLLCGFRFICISFVSMSIFMEKIVEVASSFLSHYGGFDSAASRLEMWDFGLSSLLDKDGWIFGFGTGTQNDALPPLFEVSSFHSMYVELLFEGGIVKVGIYFVLLVQAILFASRSVSFERAGLFRVLYLPFLSSWMVFSLFEAGATPFSTTFFSFISGALLFLLPRCLELEMGSRSASRNTSASIVRPFARVSLSQDKKVLDS